MLDFLKDEDNESENSENEESISINTKTRPTIPRSAIPSSFFKAKKILNRFIIEYFNGLKEDYLNHGGTIEINSSKLKDIEA